MQPLLSLLMSQKLTVVQAGNCAKDDYGHTGDLPLPQLWYVQLVFTALLFTTEQDTKVLSSWPVLWTVQLFNFCCDSLERCECYRGYKVPVQKYRDRL